MTRCPICHAWLQQGIRHFCDGSRLIEVTPDDSFWGAPEQVSPDPTVPYVITPSDRRLLRSIRIQVED